MRHGESQHNLTDAVSCKPDPKNTLTETGREQVLESAKNLKKEKIDIIYCSDLERARETAHIVAKEIGVASENIFSTSEISELNAGIYDGKTWKEYREFLLHRNLDLILHQKTEKRFGFAPSFNEVYL